MSARIANPPSIPLLDAKETDTRVGFVPSNRTVLPSVVVETSVPKFPAVSPNTILNETISSLSVSWKEYVNVQSLFAPE